MIVGSKVILREKRLGDAWDDFNWATDAELSYLDAAPILSITFTQYFAEYAHELRISSSTNRRFAVDTLDGKHIGNCSFYNVDEDNGEAELGVIIGNRDYWDKGYGTDTVRTLLNYIFCQTNLKQVYLKTLRSNNRARQCFLKCGFTPYGHMDRDGFSFSLMRVHRNQEQEQEAST